MTEVKVHDSDLTSRLIILAAIRAYCFLKNHEQELGPGGRHVLEDLRRSLAGETLGPIDDQDVSAAKDNR